MATTDQVHRKRPVHTATRLASREVASSTEWRSTDDEPVWRNFGRGSGRNTPAQTAPALDESPGHPDHKMCWTPRLRGNPELPCLERARHSGAEGRECLGESGILDEPGSQGGDFDQLSAIVIGPSKTDGWLDGSALKRRERCRDELFKPSSS
jgi:hypothetical protein